MYFCTYFAKCPISIFGDCRQNASLILLLSFGDGWMEIGREKEKKKNNKHKLLDQKI